MFNREGAWLRSIRPWAEAGVLVGGIAVDREDSLILASVSEKGKTAVSVLGYEGEFRYALDSAGWRLKRPAGLGLTNDGAHVLVADLAAHAINKFRFK